MRYIAFCLLSSTALLVGCSKPKPAEHAASVQPKPSGPAAFLAPRPRTGLWRMSISSDAGPGVKMNGEICLDAKTQEAGFNAGPQGGAAKDCSATKLSPQAGGVGFTTVCKVRGMTVTTQGVATGDFSSAYTVDATTRMDPPPQGMSEMKSHVEARWVGPCKPGQTPGTATMKFGGLGQG